MMFFGDMFHIMVMQRCNNKNPTRMDSFVLQTHRHHLKKRLVPLRTSSHMVQLVLRQPLSVSLHGTRQPWHTSFPKPLPGISERESEFLSE